MGQHVDTLDHPWFLSYTSGTTGDPKAIVVAAVVVRDPERLDVAALFTRCAERLERAHVPDYLQVVDELPKTTTQKVQARLLTESFDPSSPGVHARDKALAR